MTTKLVVSGTLLAAVTLFVWGAVSHLALPEPVVEIKDGKAVDEFVAKNAAGNGVYMDPRGVLMVVNLAADRTTVESRMGSYLAVEFVTNLAQALLMVMILVRLRPMTAMQYGVTGGLIGLCAWIGIEASYWNWYGFGLRMLEMGLLDALGGGFLAGMGIGWLINKQA